MQDDAMLIDRETGPEIDAMELGSALHEWARRNNALFSQDAAQGSIVMTLEEIFETDSEAASRIAEMLRRLKITAVAADASRAKVTLLCKNTLSSRATKALPKLAHGIDISYVGKTTIEANPPATPFSAASGSPIYFSHGGRVSCGSSVTASQVFSAGTLGFLSRLADGRMVGFSNNHVTGDCNHTPAGMHILSPSPMDATPSTPPPVAIGAHLALEPLQSGDPDQITLQKLDAAIFLIVDEARVSSMQGNGYYDTPSSTTPLQAGQRVKKTGRTTGLRYGTVIGEMTVPFYIPYKSSKFHSFVYFSNVWAVQGESGQAFSECGDSGSLVVTADDCHAVGVVFAGGGTVSYILPIDSILDRFSMTLVSSHNAEVANEQAEDVGSVAEAEAS